MKMQQFLQSLIQQLTYWRRQYKALRRKGKLLGRAKRPKGKRLRGEILRAVIKQIFLYLLKPSENGKHRKQGTAIASMAKSVKTNSGIYAIGLGWLHEKRSSAILAIAIIALTGILGHKLYNQPQLKVGTPAPQTIKAPYTASIEDKKKTEAQRKAVSGRSIPVLMIDTQINEKIDQNLQKLLDDGDEIRTVAGSFPFFDTLVLPISIQRYLRSCSEPEWQALLVAVENTRNQQRKAAGQRILVPSAYPLFPPPLTIPSLLKSDSQSTKVAPDEPKPIDFPQNANFTSAVAELAAYRNTTSEKNLSSLITRISQVRQKYTQANTKLLQMETARPETVFEGTMLLDLSDEEWAKTQTGIHETAERILTQGIPLGLPKNVLQDAVSLQVQWFVPKDAEPLAIKVLSAVLQPNLKNDQEQTEQQAQKAADGVTPVMRKVRYGEAIVNQGEQITAWNFEVLEYYHLIRREVNWLGLAKLGGIVTVAVGIFVWVEHRVNTQLRQRDRFLVLLLTLSTPGMVIMGVPYSTWSAIGILLGSFYGAASGVTVVSLLLVLVGISLEINPIGLLAGAAGGILGSCMAQRLRSREELALLGIAIALTQGGIYLIVNLLIGEAFGSNWYIVLQEAALYALSGLAWSVVALGLSPYLEKLFDLVTPIRLAELANPNRPLLKRLATETPGTFQHTLFVSTLAEAAAKQLGCNVELVRAGTLYHDIGKMHDPLGFIENQMGGPNKHDTEINDPWKSAEIIKKHVIEGLVMARKHLLPTAIQAFIPEHQGTMLIAYFYHQAQQMVQADPSLTLDEADFRYDGPIPQSRETAIVMLADSCEAALRSLKDVSPEQALTMLNNILRARWQDNQMVDSGITREEMTKIAQIFVEVWQQFHHKRIAYPKLQASNTARNS
ncbi:HD family phosphohydrolase [Nostoc sp. UHCC 0302]|uniref:HD family phosphohydrolase n=1 Tax=Nostoc sp. UHCC 0302 TaxID=3134896 RepID=UPI00311C8B0A